MNFAITHWKIPNDELLKNPMQLGFEIDYVQLGIIQMNFSLQALLVLFILFF